MKTEEVLETLMSGGADAERAFWLMETADADACKELFEHLSCLACSTTIEDAKANADHALAWIAAAPRKLRGKLADVKASIVDALDSIED